MNAAKPISEKAPLSRSSRGCLSIIGVIFSIAGIIAFCAIVIWPLWRSIQAASWATTEAAITHSEVAVNQDSDGDTYRPDIHFKFVVDGNLRSSTHYSFIRVSTSSRGWVDRAVRKYSVGSKHACYYNPRNPDDAVLERNYPLSSLFGLFSLLFVGAGVFMIFAGMSREKTPVSITGEGKPETAPLSQFTSQASDAGESFPWSGFEGPQRLQPNSSRLMNLIGIGIFALIWNSISGAGMFLVIREGQILMILFLSVFVLVGVGLLAGLVYVFLAMFNPVVEIAITNGVVSGDMEAELAWEIKGNLNRIRELVVEVTGTESATYTRGTTTITEKNIFMKLPVTQTRDREAMRFGSETIRLPANAIHSFDATKNKIEWAIVVRGEIPFWPDINESYPFFVKPASLEESANA